MSAAKIFEDEISFEPCYAPGSGRPISVEKIDNRYGDGYRQIAASSINPIERTWTLQLEALTAREWQSLDEFLKARKGVEAFLFQPPAYEGEDPDTGVTDQVSVICDSWQPSFLQGGHVSVSMSFTERFGV